MPMLSHVKSGMHLSDKLLVGENKDFPFSELCTHVVTIQPCQKNIPKK